jgi:hypothetical protein
MKALTRRRAGRQFRASGFDYDPAYEAQLRQAEAERRDCERGPDGRPGTPWQFKVESIQREAESR